LTAEHKKKEKMEPSRLVWIVVAALALVALTLSVTRKKRALYMVVKGAEGFGDRLQCLLQAIRYARKSDRRLVVDWRDDHWCHDGATGFDEYFELVGISSASFAELKGAIDDGEAIAPAQWSPDVVCDPTQVSELYAYDEFVDEPSTARCVVHPGVKFRAWHCADASSVRARPWLAERVLRAFASIPTKYTAVHLRGGDRLARLVAEHRTTRRAYVEEMRAKAGPGPVVIVSDDAGLVEEYERQCAAAGSTRPRLSGLTPPAKCVDGAAGTHLNGAGSLQCPFLTKRELNANAVCDFVVLSHADRVVADGNSLFSRMAQCVAYPAFGIRTRERTWGSSEQRTSRAETSGSGSSGAK